MEITASKAPLWAHLQQNFCIGSCAGVMCCQCFMGFQVEVLNCAIQNRRIESRADLTQSQAFRASINLLLELAMRSSICRVWLHHLICLWSVSFRYTAVRVLYMTCTGLLNILIYHVRFNGIKQNKSRFRKQQKSEKQGLYMLALRIKRLFYLVGHGHANLKL
jgi:hypothetical protein